MINVRSPIGVFDSGLGGLTVVRRIQELLPHEDILYFGDCAFMPYGNRPGSEILALANRILRFMDEHEVKVCLVACNTISSLYEYYRDNCNCRIFNIIEATCDDIAGSGLESVGVFSTVFTEKSGLYTKLLNAADPGLRVLTASSPNLAALIDHGDISSHEVDAGIQAALGNLSKQVSHLILGCTHYPLAAERIHALYPELALIDPAISLAHRIRNHLRALDWLRGCEDRNCDDCDFCDDCPDGDRGRFAFYTSGDPTSCSEIIARFGLRTPDELHQALTVLDPE